MDTAHAITILNNHVFSGSKTKLLQKIADTPERYVGLFRPTKPRGKLLQNLLQSQEIRFGDALEELIRAVLNDMGYSNLELKVETKKRRLEIDQYFTDGTAYYFIEQKIRDDHDSSKKRGQLENFDKKLGKLCHRHTNLTAIMYFIDPTLSKNKTFYAAELAQYSEFYGIPIHLFYGEELFHYLQQPHLWQDIQTWIQEWKQGIPELPEINFDASPNDTFLEIQALANRYWRKLLSNETIWTTGVMQVLFPQGTTLKLIHQKLNNNPHITSQKLARMLKAKLMEYYGESL